jgi:predicted DNA-binding mobile mystery protein A
MKNQKLIIDQIDRKLSQFQGLSQISLPEQGWIRSIRIALNMTLKQLGKRLNITPPSVKEMEDREKNGTISINILKKFGEAMDMKFVYGFIPQKGSINEIINQQAYEVAKVIVLRTAKNMELEDQLVFNGQIEKAINEKKNEIIRELPKYLWE